MALTRAVSPWCVLSIIVRIADRAARAQADVTRVWEAITPILIPLWLSAAQRLGFPRSLEGIARLHMAAYAQVSIGRSV